MDMLDTGLESSHEKDDGETEEQLTLSTDVGLMKVELMENSESGMVFSGLGAQAAEEQAAAIASVTGSGSLTLDPTLQYQLRADSGSQGQVTYRVVQVSNDGETTAQVVAGNFPTNQVTVIQSPFSNGGSPTPEQQGDTRFAYFPATAAADGSVVSTQAETITAATALAPVATGAGQFYVMMSPQDVLQSTQRTIAPRTSFSPKMEGRSSRDDRRRATHNEVERRRRDKINNWIVQLSKLIPDCAHESVKQTQASKGGILAKACEYIQELRTTNCRLSDSAKESERMRVDMDLLRNQIEELKKQNEVLRSAIMAKGIPVPQVIPDVV